MTSVFTNQSTLPRFENSRNVETTAALTVGRSELPFLRPGTRAFFSSPPAAPSVFIPESVPDVPTVQSPGSSPGSVPAVHRIRKQPDEHSDHIHAHSDRARTIEHVGSHNRAVFGIKTCRMRSSLTSGHWRWMCEARKASAQQEVSQHVRNGTKFATDFASENVFTVIVPACATFLRPCF
jgi:hypothetical protein